MPVKPAPHEKYLTTFGKGYLEPAVAVARGRVRGISPIPGGPAVARFEVEKWILTPAGSSPPPSIAVNVPSGAIEASDAPILVYLGCPETRGSALWPLIAMTRGDTEDLDAIEAWIAVESRAAELPTVDARIAAVKFGLLGELAAERLSLRSMALYELNRWCDTGLPVFVPSDVKRVESLAARAKDVEKDNARALKLLDLATRMRECMH